MGSPFLCDLFRGFNKAKDHLVFEADGAVLPTQLTVEQLLIIFKSVFSEPGLLTEHPGYHEIAWYFGIRGLILR